MFAYYDDPTGGVAEFLVDQNDWQNNDEGNKAQQELANLKPALLKGLCSSVCLLWCGMLGAEIVLLDVLVLCEF